MEKQHECEGKREREIVLIADKSLYDVWICADIDVTFLDEITIRLGKILAIDSVYDKVVDNINKMGKLSSSQRIVWQTRIKQDNKAYLDVLRSQSMNVAHIIDHIKEETATVLCVLQKLDAGASEDDVALIVNSKWLRQNTRFEPLIITDDRDLLTCGHIITSFFGLTIGFLSCFELLRLMEMNEAFDRYCKYYNLDPQYGFIDDVWTKQELEQKVSSSLRKAKISCHPSLKGSGSLLNKIKR
ncbi:MAG: hypothetical protein QW279_12095 [Candidatus Jordarchaeaceae archaeon]